MNGNHQCSTQIAVPYPQAILVKPRIAHEGMKKRVKCSVPKIVSFSRSETTVTLIKYIRTY